MQIEVRNVRTLDDVMEFKRWLGQDRPVLAYDIETSGLSWHQDKVRLAQFGDRSMSWVFTYDLWRGVVQEALLSYTGPIVGHNVRFDIHFTLHDLGLPTEALDWTRIHDTLLMAHLIDPSRPKGLKPLAARYINPAAVAGQKDLDDDMHRGKWDWATVPIDLPSYRFYAGLDTSLTALLYEKFSPYIAKHYQRAYELEQMVAKPLFIMERKGMLLDPAYTEKAQGLLLDRADEVAAEVEQTWGINVGSLQAAGEIMMADGWQPEEFTKSGNPSLTAEILETIDHPLAEKIVTWRIARKAANTWLSKFLTAVDADGRVHPNIRQVAARTGRMSVSDPPLQQLPRERDAKEKGLPSIRDCFVATPGTAIISADFSGIEARLFAHFAAEPDMLRTIHEGGDLHALVAAAAYQIPIGEVTKDQRQIAKAVNFACCVLDTDVLTVERGWVPIAEVQVGETVYGFEDGHTTHTKVEATHYYESAPVIEFGNTHRRFRCTPNHRWITTNNGLREWQDLSPVDDLLLAAPCAEADRSGFTSDEAALLAWLITDGHVQSAPLTYQRSQGSDGQRQACRATLFQKPGSIAYGELRALLRRLGISDDPRPHGNSTAHGFPLPTQWTRDLIRRYVFDVTQFRGPDLLLLVQRFGPNQRRAFLDAFHLAEGFVHKTTPVFGQNDGYVQEALVLALAMEGFYPSVSRKSDPRSSVEHCTTRAGDPEVTVRYMQEATPLTDQPVACITTGLGTFLARQGDRIFLTGNSLYGAGPAKVAKTAKISEEESRDFFTRRNSAFPGIKKFQYRVMDRADEQRRSGETAHVTTHIGSRISIRDDEPEYRLTNYLIQGSAAVVLKDRILSLHNAGLTDMMCLPVHDEVLFEVPVDDAEEVRRMIADNMPDLTTFDVPLAVEISDPAPSWGAAK